MARQTKPMTAPRLAYQPGLDGLRALAVTGVLLYHAGYTWIPGGFLGVEVFFVISGYLITALLVEEYRADGLIRLKKFWLRRARRLLPALFMLVGLVCTYTAVFLPAEAAKIRGDAVAALLYSTNFYLIFSKQSYFAALGRPSLFRHLWSLAVEEQWYLCWPVVFFAFMRIVRGRAVRLVTPILLLALGSTLLMRALFVPDVDPSRVYYSTDTRASGLLIGAALACFWAPWRRRWPVASIVPDLVGAAALLAVIAFAVNGDEYAPFLYRGGFTLLSIATAVLIAAVVHPQARIMRTVLGCRPLRWIGLRSYGIYLWHWPVYLVMRPQDVGFEGWRLMAARLAVIVVLVELSYRFVEMPVRSGLITRLWSRVKRSDGYQRAGLLGTTGLSAACVSAVLVLVGVQLARADKVDLLAGPEVSTDGTVASSGSPSTTTATVLSTIVSSVANPGSGGTSGAAAPGHLPRHVTIVGDSVAKMLVRNAPSSAKQVFAMVDGAIEGCGIVDGSMRSSSRQRRTFAGCESWPQQWANSVFNSRADIALVSIGAWEVFDLVRDRTTLTFGTPDYDTYLLGQLRAGVQALEPTGAQIAFLEVPCYRPVDGGGLRALPERGDDSRTRHVNSLIRQVATEDPAHVTVIPSPPEYCTDSKVATDLNERWDGVHYYKPGAKRVWDYITNALLAIPVRSRA